ncbi:MAG TPA: hypothetical protein PK821_01370 [Victivallales bacterium]|nr:hypothetical protein [Victivallales bacterium]
MNPELLFETSKITARNDIIQKEVLKWAILGRRGRRKFLGINAENREEPAGIRTSSRL